MAAIRLMYVARQTKFNEVVAYFNVPELFGKHERIRLKVTARAPEPEMKGRIEQHRRELTSILVKAVLPGPGRPIELRHSRREILKVLGPENKTKAVAIDIVPDFSTMRPRREIQELLEKAHSVPKPEAPTKSPFK